MFWNTVQPPADVLEAFGAVYRRVTPDLPFNPWATSASDGYQVLCTKAADGIHEVGRVRRPRTVAIRLGAVLQPGRVAGPASYGRRPWPASRVTAPGTARGHRSRYRRAGRELHYALRRAGGHCGANRFRLRKRGATISMFPLPDGGKAPPCRE